MRIDAHVNELAGAVRQSDRLAAPEFLNDGDPFGHDFAPALVIPRRENKVIHMPTRRAGYSDPSTGQVIDHRPLLGDTQRILKRDNDAAGANLYLLGERRRRGAENSGIGIQTAERMEMPLRRPDRREVILVGVLQAFEK